MDLAAGPLDRADQGARARSPPGAPTSPTRAATRRLLAIPEIGPWTVQCLGLRGRGDPDSLPAGDLAYVKLVGHLAGLGRRARVEEVEEFFAPYAPFRGLAGTFALVGYHGPGGGGPAAAARGRAASGLGLAALARLGEQRFDLGLALDRDGDVALDDRAAAVDADPRESPPSFGLRSTAMWLTW